MAEFVLAHELGHVRNRDTLTMTVAATLSGAIGMLATFGGLLGGGRDENGRPLVNPIVAIAAMILAPLAASLVQMAISRSREYEADRAGAEISGNPLWLASALQRLHEGTQAIPNATAEANPATAHLYIDNPLSAGGLCEPVLDPSADGGAHRPPAGDGARQHAAPPPSAVAGDVGAPWRLGAANRPRPLGIDAFRRAHSWAMEPRVATSFCWRFLEGHCP